MARLPDEIIDSIVFLYASREAALNGTEPGGTGFIVGMPLGVHDAVVRYLVTAQHVFAEGGRFARVNRRDGSLGVIELGHDLWLPSYTTADVAVAMLPMEDRHEWQFTNLLWPEWVLERHDLDEEAVGLGDEVAMLGRQVNYEGVDRNQPIARFGHISMMAGVPIRDGRGFEVEAFLVEIRSQGGFSGSPVVLVVPPFAYRAGRDSVSGAATFGLLGVMTGHVQGRSLVVGSPRDPIDVGQQPASLYVRENLGLGIVSPAWEVDAILNGDDAAARRQAILDAADFDLPPR